MFFILSLVGLSCAPQALHWQPIVLLLKCARSSADIGSVADIGAPADTEAPADIEVHSCRYFFRVGLPGLQNSSAALNGASKVCSLNT
jgi:hypothetical protein